MRSFYLTYCQNEKLQPVVAEISWTHNLTEPEQVARLLEGME